MPESGRSPGGGNDNPPQYSCLENPMDRGAWWATVQGVAKSQTRLSRSMDGPLWVKPAQPPLPPPQEGRGPAVPSGRGVHHQGRPGGNGQRPPNFPPGLHPRLSPQRENHHEVQAATLSHVGGGHGNHEVDKLGKSHRSYPGSVGRGPSRETRASEVKWLSSRSPRGAMLPGQQLGGMYPGNPQSWA